MAETRLRQLIRSRRLTLSALAQILQIPLSRLSMIVAGHRPATVHIATRIAEELGVSVEEVFLPESFTVREDTLETVG